MDEFLAQIFQVGFFAALIRIATPLILATIGELYAERSGVLNLGIEGTMLLGAMAGFSAGYFSGSLWLGVLAAMLAGMVMGLIMGLTTVTLGLSQHVSGIGVTLLGVALVRELRERGFFAGREEPKLIDLLDLVALGTVADVARLHTLNRAFVTQGLKVMAGRGNTGLAEAKRDNKPVLIDFWATWCKNCLVMDSTTLKDPQVTAALGSYVKIKFQAEDPEASPAKEVLEYVGGIGLPTYAILKAK